MLVNGVNNAQQAQQAQSSATVDAATRRRGDEKNRMEGVMMDLLRVGKDPQNKVRVVVVVGVVVVVVVGDTEHGGL
jgi:hypothetical protein